MDTECIPPINTSLKKMDNFFVLERKLERIRRRQIRNQYKRRPRYIGGSKSDSEYLNTNISLKMVKSDNEVEAIIILAAKSVLPCIAFTIIKLAEAVGEATRKNSTPVASPSIGKINTSMISIIGLSVTFQILAIVAGYIFFLSCKKLRDPPIAKRAKGKIIWLR